MFYEIHFVYTEQTDVLPTDVPRRAVYIIDTDNIAFANVTRRHTNWIGMYSATYTMCDSTVGGRVGGGGGARYVSSAPCVAPSQGPARRK